MAIAAEHAVEDSSGRRRLLTGNNASCAYILQADPSATTGVYTIDPVGGDPFSVYCDMTTDGGGWELITARETNVLSSTTGSVVMPTSKGYAVTDARLLHDHGKYFTYFQECNHLF